MKETKLLTNISPDIREDVPVSATQNLGVNEFKNTVTAKKKKPNQRLKVLKLQICRCLYEWRNISRLISSMRFI